MGNKHIANKGVPRNKRPLSNIVYEVELIQLLDDADAKQFARYRFKELGHLVLYWWHEGHDHRRNQHGFITPDELKDLLGTGQWAKFCQGKRQFIIQRRVEGKNVKKVTDNKK